MQLINVNKISYTAYPELLDFEVVADLGTGVHETIPFTYHADDTEGLGPQVKAWYQANPDFPVDPYIAPETPKRLEGEFRDFMKMFTQQEQINIVTATLSDPLVKLWYDNAIGGATFRLDHPETAQGLAYLVSAQLLTQERTDIILDGDFDDLPTF